MHISYMCISLQEIAWDVCLLYAFERYLIVCSIQQCSMQVDLLPGGRYILEGKKCAQPMRASEKTGGSRDTETHLRKTDGSDHSK